MRRTNPDPDALNYQPREPEIVFSRITRQVDWLVIAGPGSANEVTDAHHRWPRCSILGIEPSPVGFRAAAAKWPSGHGLIRKALWNCETEIPLYYPDDLLHSTIFPNNESRESSRSPSDLATDDVELVYTTTLDRLDTLYGPFNNGILWMDIEGAERIALDGGEQVLSRKGGFHTVVLEVFWGTADATAARLSRHGFKLDYVYYSSTTRFNGMWIR